MKPKHWKGLSTEEMLDALGLERKSEPGEQLLPVLGVFAAGLLVGTGIGMAIGPMITAAARARLEERAEEEESRPNGAQTH